METFFYISFNNSIVPLLITTLFTAGAYDYMHNDSTCLIGPENVCAYVEQKFPERDFRTADNMRYLRRPAAYRKMCTFDGEFERVRSVCVDRLMADLL